VVAAATPDGVPGRLGLLVDEDTKQRFLVDCGSVFSILPFSSKDLPAGPRIVAADKSPIACWGWCSRTLHVRGKAFTWRFLKAAVAFPIVGADFLSHFDLKIDLKRMRLEHGTSKWHVALAAPPAGSTFAAIGVQLASVGGSLDMEETTCGQSGDLQGRRALQRTALRASSWSEQPGSLDTEETTRGQSGGPALLR